MHAVRKRQPPEWFVRILWGYDPSLRIVWAVEDYPRPAFGEFWTFRPHWRIERRIDCGRAIDPKYFYGRARRKRARNVTAVQSPINNFLARRDGYVCAKVLPPDAFETGFWKWVLPALRATDVRRFGGWEKYADLLEDYERYEAEKQEAQFMDRLKGIHPDAWAHAQYQLGHRVGMRL